MVFLKKHDIITAVYYFPAGFSLPLSLSFLNGSERLSFHRRSERSEVTVGADGWGGGFLSVTGKLRMPGERSGVACWVRRGVQWRLSLRLDCGLIQPVYDEPPKQPLCLLFWPVLTVTVHLLENCNFLLFRGII